MDAFFNPYLILMLAKHRKRFVVVFKICFFFFSLLHFDMHLLTVVAGPGHTNYNLHYQTNPGL